MATVDELIKQKIKRLDSVGDKFAQKTAEVQKTMLKNALKQLEKLKRDGDGNIIADSQNLDKVQQIIFSIEDTLNDDEYASLVEGLMNEMDKQAKINDEILAAQFESITTRTKSFADQVLQKIKTATRQNLYNVSNSQLSAGLNQFLNTAISSGASYTDVYTYVQDFLIGAEKKDGALVRYTRQIANDGFAIADRSRINVIAESVGAQFFRYQGGTIDTTRCFCEERNGLIFHIEEIRAWGDGDITAGGLSSECGYPWAGMNAGTNSGNILDLLGGYNCLHTLMPVSEIDVPRDVLIRAMEQGYYEPSENIRDLLGI